MKLHKLIMVWVGIILTFSVSATDLKDARIYINPGHGGWTANDRPMATINYAQMDIRGFFETNTNLIKGLALRDELVKAGPDSSKCPVHKMVLSRQVIRMRLKMIR